MATGWKGVHEGGKWFSSAVIQLFTNLGFSDAVHYHRVCLDTGSPYIILPGQCPSPPSDSDSFPDIVGVEVAGDSSGERMKIDLPPRGRVIRLGGVGGTRRERYLFCADVAVEGLVYDDLVDVVFFDPDELRYPIIGLAEIVESGRRVTFSSKGFRIR